MMRKPLRIRGNPILRKNVGNLSLAQRTMTARVYADPTSQAALPVLPAHATRSLATFVEDVLLATGCLLRF